MRSLLGAKGSALVFVFNKLDMYVVTCVFVSTQTHQQIVD